MPILSRDPICEVLDGQLMFQKRKQKKDIWNAIGMKVYAFTVMSLIIKQVIASTVAISIKNYNIDTVSKGNIESTTYAARSICKN